MNKLFRTLGIACTVSVLLSSCIDIMEELVLNKNGSGKYDLTMDMSEMFENPLMKGVLEADDDKDKSMEETDSLVYFKDMPDSLKGENPEVWDRTTLHIVFLPKLEKFYTTIHCDFKNLDELAYVSENMEKMMKSARDIPLSGDDMPSQLSPTGLMGKGIKYSLKGRELIRTSGQSNVENEPDEEMEMLKGFLSEAKYKASFTLPGKVKKVTIPGAKIDGNKVSIVISMIEMMEKKMTMDGSIWFR